MKRIEEPFGLLNYIGENMLLKKDNSRDENFMIFIPVRKIKTWEVRKGKVVLIFHHNKAIERFVRWLVKKPLESYIELDELGSATWQLMDGKNTVHDIGQKLLEKYGEKVQPVNDRVIMFVRYLNRRGWISFEK